MTLPVPGPTTAELVSLFEAVHQGLTERDQARAELATERERSAKLGLDLRSAEDRIARQERTQTDSDTLVRRLRDIAATPLRQGSRDHLGPVVLCWCGMAHGAAQVTALNGKVIVADSAETPYLEARDIPAAGRDRIEKNT